MSINQRHYCYYYNSPDNPEAQWWSQHMMDSSSAARTSSPPPNHNTAFVSGHHSIPSTTATFWANTHHLHQYHDAAATGAMFYGQNSTSLSFNLNNDDDEDDRLMEEMESDNITSRESGHVVDVDQQIEIPKDPLFEKPLTPSDVGKLNRLVIPKQHAERYFPLNGRESGEKGLLLSFEDEVGKSWRFRYSYWNSSQSYVLTKGWSRFVKEKRLDAGDIVLFLRHRLDGGRFFIGWRRRNSANGVAQPAFSEVVPGGGGGCSRVYYSGHPYPSQNQGHSSIPYQADSVHAGGVSVAAQNQTAAAAASGNSKRLRLFGVNMECQADASCSWSEPSTPVGSPMSSSQGQAHQHHPYHQQQYYYSGHMDVNISGGGGGRGGGDMHRQG